MTLTLYYGSGSPYAWRVNLALEHKALPYECKVLSFGQGDLKKPDFMARIEALPFYESCVPPTWRAQPQPQPQPARQATG